MLFNDEKKIKVDITNLVVKAEPRSNSANVEYCKPGIYKVLDTRNGYIKIGEGRYVNAAYAIPVEKTKEPVNKKFKEESKPISEDIKPVVEDTIEVGEE